MKWVSGSGNRGVLAFYWNESINQSIKEEKEKKKA